MKKATEKEIPGFLAHVFIRKRQARLLLVTVTLFVLLGTSTFLLSANAVDQPGIEGSGSTLAGDSGEDGLTDASLAVSSPRERVKIMNGNVVADNNYPLRGEHIIFSENNVANTPAGWLDRMYDVTFWTTLRDDYHLNTVRLMMMRPPQNWPGGPGDDCFYPAYRCLPLDHTLENGRTVLQAMDDMVNIAADLGMYIIIDYHPVGGHNKADAIAWWNVVAPRYKGRTHVLYELSNEPVAWNASAYDADDIDFEEDLYVLIRGHAPQTHIILWTFANATGPMLERVQAGTRISYNKASVGFHPYAYDEAKILNLRSQYPVINTEIGSNRLASIQKAEDIGVSWIMLAGAKTHDTYPNGFGPSRVFWPKDPGTGTGTPLPGSDVFVSSNTGGRAGGVSFGDEDILSYDSSTDSWSLYFDGSDVQLHKSGYQDVDAFQILEDGSILLSLYGSTTVPDVGRVDDSDILQFVPTSLGSNTAGTFSLYFDGSDVELTTSGEDINALALLPDGDLIVSTSGSGKVSGMRFKDEDLMRFSPSELGADTAGTWSLYFDGSDVKLHNTANEDIWGLSLSDASDTIFLSTKGRFSVADLKGDGADIFQCQPTSLGSSTSCSFQLEWDGSANGFGGEIADGITVLAE